ncbi:MAG: hypothetical protein NZ846_08245 [Thermus sp.]|uniref:hypothetical protein n=1 Tax=Thermus sp. TaxID=275 RepID=UPI0025DC421E|nr:hypothetical protein [Thermus sp.]MCS6868970.1 hypothetical protein [Thermus sp.]MCS7218945.1 hypothetical protein [Thermus sp.]MDW8017326.1 hypothetical protein [Thermus sp.]MDW8356874.1 hypothetical protein [Thermus sp.]
MRAFLANLEALFLALAFGSLLFGLLARLLGVRQAWPFFLLAALFLALGLFFGLK